MNTTGLVFYDVSRTPEPAMASYLRTRRVLREGFEPGEPTDPMEYFRSIGVWNAGGGVTPPLDSDTATMARLYMLARSDVMLVHLDVCNCPEMWVAANAGIPIVGVTERFNIYPVVASLVTTMVAPNRKSILTVLRALGGVEATIGLAEPTFTS